MTSGDKVKRQRIMIISGDESIIDEIKNNKNVSLCKSLILETQNEDMGQSYAEVKTKLILFRKSKKFYFILS
jgi:hypothetical protein